MACSPSQPLPVTAYSCCNGLGSTRAEVLEKLRLGTTGLVPARMELPFATCVGEVTAELPHLPNALAPWSTRMSRMAALLVQGLEPRLTRARALWPASRIAVILGTSTAGAAATETAYRHYVAHGELPAEYDFRRQHTFGALLRVVAELGGAKGPAWMISTACTSSAKPLASAKRLIDADLIDAAIIGGFDTLCGMTLHGFRSLGALATDPCRPFCASRSGISIGEGGALLLVERKAHALALVEGVGESSDAYHVSSPHPEGLGARSAMQRALDEAGCGMDAIDHINAHGTGTRLNDVAEARAIAELFDSQVPVVSTKGYTGHMLGAAGATEAVMSIFAIEEGWVPTSVGSTPLDPKIELHVPTTRTCGCFRRVLSNDFAFGGNNVSVLMGAP